MTMSTFGAAAATMKSSETMKKAKMLTYKVRVTFVLKGKKEFNVKTSLHSILSKMVDSEKATTFKDVMAFVSLLQR